jgi:hypothetical protein
MTVRLCDEEVSLMDVQRWGCMTAHLFVNVIQDAGEKFCLDG